MLVNGCWAIFIEMKVKCSCNKNCDVPECSHKIVHENCDHAACYRKNPRRYPNMEKWYKENCVDTNCRGCISILEWSILKVLEKK
jgi:hypothetical protein